MNVVYNVYFQIRVSWESTKLKAFKTDLPCVLLNDNVFLKNRTKFCKSFEVTFLSLRSILIYYD